MTVRSPVRAIAKALTSLCVALFIAVQSGMAAPAMAAATATASDPRVTQARDPRVAEALAAMRKDGSYQFDFPSRPPEPPPPRLEWLARLIQWLTTDGQGLLQFLFWGLVGVAALAVLYWTVPVFRELVDTLIARLRRRVPQSGANDADWQPDPGQSRNLLNEADALAAEGRFADAVRLLLGRSVEDIAVRRPGVLRPALTARAIAAIGALPDSARAAFARISDAVERSHWAGRPLNADGWQQARAAYEDFAFGPHWRGGGAA